LSSAARKGVVHVAQNLKQFSEKVRRGGRREEGEGKRAKGEKGRRIGGEGERRGIL
jgi:hypothetical protein